MDGQGIVSFPNDLGGSRRAWNRPVVGTGAATADLLRTGSGLRSAAWFDALSRLWP